MQFIVSSARSRFTPALAMAGFIRDRGLVPHLLVHSECVQDLLGPEGGSSGDKTPNCVVIGDAMHGFTYENMNKCFQLLMSSDRDVQIFSLGKGKYYQVRMLYSIWKVAY